MTELFVQPLFDWRSAVSSSYGPKSPTTRHVLLALSLHMSPKGDSCYPSQETLSRETGLSLRAVVKHLTAAQKNGWLAKVERERNAKGWRRVEYYAIIPQGVEEAVKEQAETERGAPRARREPRARGTKPRARESKPTMHHVRKSSSLSSSTTAATAPVESYPQGQGAAADLVWPSKIPHGQRSAIEHYLKANTSKNPQQLLDELEGVMRDELVRDPVAFFLHIAQQQAAGKFLPSHAHRVQVEREGQELERELRERTNA